MVTWLNESVALFIYLSSHTFLPRVLKTFLTHYSLDEDGRLWERY